MKQISAAMFLTAALSLGVSAFAQTTPTNPTGQVDQPTGQAAPQKPADLKDVPAGHWAQEAIKIAADCGIIRGYPDGTFRGNQPITRYEAAAIVARLIAAVKSGACGIGTPGTAGFMITEEQYNDLMSAVQELQADLAQLGVRVAELEDNAVTQDDLARVEELATQARDIAEQAATTADDAAAAAADAADAAAAAQEAADAAQEAADANADAIQAAQDAADAAQEAADAAQASADDALAQLADLEVTPAGDIIDTSGFASADDIAALQDQIDALQEAIDGMEPTAEFDPTELQGQLDDLTGTVDDLQSQIDDLNAQIAEGTVTTPEGEVFDPTDLQDQIDDLQAQIADTQDQISALTDAVNAQQETVDGLVDAVAGTQDDIGTLQDVTADLQAQIDALTGAEGVDPQAMQDLMDAVDAASIAADTALAQSRELQDKVDELDGRVTDLESGLGELGATVESQADSIAALNDLVVLLNQDVLSLQDRVTQLERQVDELSNAEPVEPGVDLTDDLDSLREFTTLLRRDQTALADTVGDLEARVGALETKVDTGLAALDKRVTDLEANGFKISGTLGLAYDRSTTWAGVGNGSSPDFDIDRLGLNTGLSRGAFVDGDSATDYTDFRRAYPTNTGPTAVSSFGGLPTPGSTAARTEGRTVANLSLKFSFNARNLSSGFQSFPLTLALTLSNGGDFKASNDYGDSIETVFSLDSIQALFAVGAAPVVINFGIAPAFAFTNYGFNNAGGRGDGFVATVDASSLLPGLNPTLTIVYGSKGTGTGYVDSGAKTTLDIDSTKDEYIVRSVVSSNGRTRLELQLKTDFDKYHVFITYANGDVKDLVVGNDFQVITLAGPDSSSITKVEVIGQAQDFAGGGGNGDNLYYTGAKGSLSLIPGIVGGVYVANENKDIRGVQAPTLLYGFDAKGTAFGFLKLDAELNKSDVTGKASQAAGYVKVGIDLGIFSIGGNFRSVDSSYVGLGDDGNYVYKLNQTGFGVDLAANKLFGFLDLSAYYDSRSRIDPTASLGNGPKNDTVFGNFSTGSTSAVNFGVGVGIRLIGFDITARFFSVSENPSALNASGINVGLKHDGSKSDALIGGFNLALGFKSASSNLANISAGGLDVNVANGNSTQLYAYADTSISFSGITIAPKAYFNTTNIAGKGTTTNLGAGIKIETPFLFSSKLSFGAALDQTSGADKGSTGWVAITLAWDSFLLPNSSFSVGFASRTDGTRNGNKFGPSFGSPTDSWGSNNATTSFNESGLYFNFGYYGLSFRYGIFALSNISGATPVVSFGSKFRILYNLKF
jgi:predicted  nucleic acid-binding Zn-ribbon protein